MKVYIGKYPNRLTCRVHTRYMDSKYGYVDWPEPEEQTRFQRSLELFEDAVQSVYNVFNWIWYDRRKQKVKIRIDRQDTWSMDHTLAHIILPMLVQLKATKHGAPYVDPKDVPKELQPKKQTKKQKDNGETDSTHFERWDWVLDEMIFAFDSKVNDGWEEQFETGESDIQWKTLEGGMSEMVRGPNDTKVYDWEGRKKYEERIANGFRLFGKYYSSLWD